MPVEFLHGRPLAPEELEMIRAQIEDCDTIDKIDPEIRGIVARNWPHLLAKLPPEDVRLGVLRRRRFAARSARYSAQNR
jgi:hypothetical protein